MGHVRQYKSNFFKIFGFVEMFLVNVLGVSCVILAVFKHDASYFTLAGVLLIPIAIVVPFMEIDAWIYAFKHWRGET